MDRRNILVLLGASFLSSCTKGPNTPTSKSASSESTGPAVETAASPADNSPVRWRDIISLDGIKDNKLKVRVSQFLDYFEKASIPFAFMDSNTSEIKEKTFKGQAVLKLIEEKLKLYKDSGFYKWAEENNHMSGGKFRVISHDKPFAGTKETGCNTKFIGVSDALLPVEIALGTDYLKRAKYRGTDGKDYPVSIEGVMTNELAHLASGTNEENSNDLENIVAVYLGAVQRKGLFVTTDQFPRKNYTSLLNAQAGGNSPKPEPSP